jgi:hypothetical protein
MYFHPTFDEFAKMAQAKKTRIETQKINAELNHKSALNELHDVFLAFAIQMYPYFEETRKVSGLNDLYFSINENNWDYEVTYYSDRRIEVILTYDTRHFIILVFQAVHGQEGSASIVENLTTSDADINHAIKYFQNPTFMSAMTDKLLECIQ